MRSLTWLCVAVGFASFVLKDWQGAITGFLCGGVVGGRD